MCVSFNTQREISQCPAIVNINSSFHILFSCGQPASSFVEILIFVFHTLVMLFHDRCRIVV